MRGLEKVIERASSGWRAAPLVVAWFASSCCDISSIRTQSLPDGFVAYPTTRLCFTIALANRRGIAQRGQRRVSFHRHSACRATGTFQERPRLPASTHSDSSSTRSQVSTATAGRDTKEVNLRIRVGTGTFGRVCRERCCGCARAAEQGMKLTSVERTGRSQLIPVFDGPGRMGDDSPDDMKTLVVLGSVILAVLAVFAEPFGRTELPHVRPILTADSTPRTLDECFIVLAKTVPADTLERMRAMRKTTLSSFTTAWARGCGTIGAYGLAVPLYVFPADGPRAPRRYVGRHPHILWRYLHGKPLEVEAQVRRYQLYWRYAKHPDPHSNPRCSTGIEIMLTVGTSPAATCRRLFTWQVLFGRSGVVVRGGPRLVSSRCSQMAIWNTDPDQRCDPCREPACPYDE